MESCGAIYKCQGWKCIQAGADMVSGENFLESYDKCSEDIKHACGAFSGAESCQGLLYIY
jgi:hypothetical protein